MQQVRLRYPFPPGRRTVRLTWPKRASITLPAFKLGKCLTCSTLGAARYLLSRLRTSDEYGAHGRCPFPLGLASSRRPFRVHLRAALPLGVVIGHAILLPRGYRPTATKGQRWIRVRIRRPPVKVLSQPELPSFRHRDPGRAKARISVQLTPSPPVESGQVMPISSATEGCGRACGQARCR